MNQLKAAGLVALLVAGPVLAQATTAAPKFTYTEVPKEDAKPTGWKAEATAGVLPKGLPAGSAAYLKTFDSLTQLQFVYTFG